MVVLRGLWTETGGKDMIFNSDEYLLLLLPGALLLYFFLNRLRFSGVSKLWLVAASFFFYSWSSTRYLPLLAGSVLFNFLIGSMLSRSNVWSRSTRRSLLFIAIAANIMVLVYCKYSDFLVANVNYLLSTSFSVRHLALPLAVSFFTFTQLAYLVDTYRDPSRRDTLLDYSLFVSFFPYLIAGPIPRRMEIMPQLDRIKAAVPDYHNLLVGLCLLFVGLIKKVLIADHFAEWSANGFDVLSHPNFLQAWAASLSYTFQIYFDFSGYTDMAIGSALMFNIKLPLNFNSPYKALDIQDFWRRWHITLSRFLRDYVYIPLGGSRAEEGRVCLNLMATFLICGLWHGAGWTFLFWGFLHGSAIIVHRLWKKFGMGLPVWLAWVATFNFVNAAWVFFRARKWSDATKVLAGMCGFNSVVLPDILPSKGLAFLRAAGIHFMRWDEIMQGGRDVYIYIAAALGVCLLLRNSNRLLDEYRPDWKVLFVMAAGAYAMLNMEKLTEFLYFNF